MGYPLVVSRGVGSTKLNKLKALSIAIRYTNLADPQLLLDHAHDDADRIVELLTAKFGYAEDDITVLKDCDGPLNCNPTRKNILKAMHDLVDDARPGDHLVCHISGHGSQVPCLVLGQEEDGYDEVFWPMDIENPKDPKDIKNFIRDDDIKRILIDSLPAGVSLVLIADCCHSGTIADLPYGHSDHMLRKQNFHVEDRKQSYNSGAERELKSAAVDLGEKQTMGSAFPIPNVTCWSACKDAQSTYNIKSGGLFVKLLIQSICENMSQTHEQLLNNVSKKLRWLMESYSQLTPRGDASEVIPPKPHLSTLCPHELVLELPILETFGGSTVTLPPNSLISSTANDI